MSGLLKLFAVIIFIPCLIACAGSSMNFREGIDNFRAQNYRSAFIHLMPEAKKGNPEAQYAVGYMYYYGQGVVEDRQKAWEWINRAATSGQADAIEAVKIMGPGMALDPAPVPIPQRR